MDRVTDRSGHLSLASDRVATVGSGRVAIIVLGMHRAGTSALTGVLHMLGAAVPKDLQAASEFNPKGNWESRAIMQLNDRILRAGASSWKDWTAFDADRIAPDSRSAFEAEIAEIVAAEFGSAALILVKDPRICRLAPLWLSALQRAGIEPKIIVPIRNPLECAASLRDRDKFEIQEGLMLWLRHVLDAERFTRGRDRCFVSFADLLRDWRTVTDRIAAALRVDWPIPPLEAGGDIDRFLSRDLRHHRVSFPDIQDRTDGFGWVSAVHESVMALGDLPEWPEAILDRLDVVHREFDKVSRAFGPLLLQKNTEAQAAADQSKLQRRQMHNDLIRVRMALHNAAEENRKICGSFSWRALTPLRKLRERLARLVGRDEEVDGRPEADLAGLIRASGLFDPAWYLETYEDVRTSTLDPAIHYLRIGAAEGRDPSALFSTAAYRQRHRDVAAAGVNPLVHFLESGIDEGRQFEPASAPPSFRNDRDSGSVEE